MLWRLSQKEQTSVRILKERREGWEDEDKKPEEGRKMTLKGRRGLIDAPLHLKISGSLVVASTEVSARARVCVRESESRGAKCVCALHRLLGCVAWRACVRVREKTEVFLLLWLLPPPPPLHHESKESSASGWRQEIRCEQRITCSIWPGSGAAAGGAR